MRDYEKEFERIRDLYINLKEENLLLRECVEFYSEEFTSWEGGMIIPQDKEVTENNNYSGGKKARETLEKIKELEQTTHEV